MQNQRILVVIGSLMVGGTETFLVRYLSNLARQGWDIELFTLAYHPGVLAGDLQKNGVTVTSLLNEKDQQRLSRYPKWLERVNRIFLCIFRLSRYLRKETRKNIRKDIRNEIRKETRKEKSAILHLFLPEAYVLGMIAAQLGGFSGPKVMSRRSLNYYQLKRPVVAWLEKKIHQYTAVVIGNSSPVIEQLHEEGIAREKIRLIYNGLEYSNLEGLKSIESASLSLTDPTNTGPTNLSTDDIRNNQKNNLRNNLRNKLGIQQTELVFIIVANLIPYKGHADLLQALHLIKDEIRDKIQQPWKLICVGRDQGIAEELKSLAQDYQINNNILWLGERKDVPSLLQCADVGILCSHEEGFSNAVLEAMAAGLPMVVTNVGGNAEAVIDNVTGYVVPAKNPKALGEALLKLMSDKNNLHAFGMKARQRVMEHFSLEKCVEQHVAVYRELYPKLK